MKYLKRYNDIIKEALSEETRNTVNPGDWIIKAKTEAGEEYGLSQAKFPKVYDVNSAKKPDNPEIAKLGFMEYNIIPETRTAIICNKDMINFLKSKFNSYTKENPITQSDIHKLLLTMKDKYVNCRKRKSAYKLMKYLKKYNEKTFIKLPIRKDFYKPSLKPEIIQTIKDICLELEDNGFRVFKNQLSFNKLGERHEGFYPHIEFRKDIDQFYYNEIKDVIERIKYYMDSVGYKSIMKFYVYPSLSYGYEDRNKIKSPLSYVRIDFKKKILPKITNFFVKESVVDDIKDFSLWKLSEEDIESYMLELIDARYNILVDYGFCINTANRDWKGNVTYKDKFTNKIISGESIRPAYWITIEEQHYKPTNENVTDTFQFAHNIIADHADADIEVRDNDGKLKMEDIVIKGGLWIESQTFDNDKERIELLPAERYIALFVKQKSEIKLNQIELAAYYNWRDYIIKEGTNWICVEISLEDMADIMLTKNESYKKILVNGEEHLYDNYWGGDYMPDIESMFSYSLDKENSVLLIKCLIKEHGGLEEFKKNDEIPDLPEDELINFLLKERFHRILKNICKESEIVTDTRRTIADWEMWAHADQNYDEIVEEFDEIVGKEFEFSKIQKEVTKYYDSKDSEGNKTKHPYQTTETFYIIEYDNKWIEDCHEEDIDDYIKDKSLTTIFSEWCSSSSFSYTMKPNFSDFGHVNKVALNKDIKHELESYLKS